MKLPPGARTITITTGGTTTVTTQVPAAGTPLRMGTLVFEWDADRGVYWSPIGPSWIDPHPDGTVDGASGVSPNAYAYAGIWS